MNLVVQAVGTQQGATGNITVAWPAHVAGDIAYLCIETQAGASKATLLTASGFVLAAQSADSGTADAARSCKMTVYWCRATSNAMANVVVSDSGDHNWGVIFTMRNAVASGDPFEVFTTGIKDVASTALSMTGVTTTKNNQIISYILAADLDTVNAIISGTMADANLANIVTQFDLGTGANNGGQLAIITGELATPGASGTMTGTSAASSKNAWVVISTLGDDSVTPSGGSNSNFLMFM